MTILFFHDYQYAHTHTHLQVPALHKLTLVCLLDDDAHPMISSVFMDGGMQAIDKMYKDVSIIMQMYEDVIYGIFSLHSYF